MSVLPSKNILAKDVIGFAQNILGEEFSKYLVKQVGIQFYNQALLEIYGIVSLIEPQAYYGYLDFTESSGLANVSGKHYTIDLSNALNHSNIITIYCTTDDVVIESFNVTDEEFEAYLRIGHALFPYSQSMVYTVQRNRIEIIFGDEVDVVNPRVSVLVQRNPELLNTTNYDELGMDLPETYYPLLANRIASFVELQHGINDNTFAVVKNLYEQMMADKGVEIKNKIMKQLKMGE